METSIELRYAGVVIGKATTPGDVNGELIFLAIPDPLPVGTRVGLKVDDRILEGRVVGVTESSDLTKNGMRVKIGGPAGTAISASPSPSPSPSPAAASPAASPPAASPSEPSPSPPPSAAAPAPEEAPTSSTPASALEEAGTDGTAGAQADAADGVPVAEESGGPSAGAGGGGGGRRRRRKR